MKTNNSQPAAPWPAEAIYARLGPPTRVLRRSDDAELRVTHIEPLGLDIRIFRKSPNEAGDFDAYIATNAGFVLPVAQAREFLGLLTETVEELER